MSGLEAALGLLPTDLREAARRLAEKERAEEFRLRMGERPTALLPEGERELPGCGAVSPEQLRRVLELATQASPFASLEAVRQGYVTAGGGVRVGLCGLVRPGSGGSWALSGLTSAAIRIPREVVGCGEAYCASPFVSTLIVSPPGAGKTTLLRDMVRTLSDRGVRVALCDEREEVAALTPAGFGFRVGRHTDVLSQLPKAQAAMQLIRTMDPQLLAMDELGSAEDIAACLAAEGCGVQLLATAHGEGREELLRRKCLWELMETGVFRRIIRIERRGGRREYREEWL